ncbi:MAG: hypothetical protein K2N32_03015 [Clostridia bacterium]|nr:hypothetical protein [Clostridia bacterium]
MLRRSRINKYAYTLCLAVIFLCFAISVIMPNYACAAATTYSNVFDDLRSADNFDVGLYPANSRDSSIYVIQIAESEDRELFIYTYQPCQRMKVLTATKINMSLAKKVDSTKLYDLTLLSSEGVFCKYIVNDFTVSDKDVRYYNISSIYRNFLDGIDTDTAEDLDNKIIGKSFAVGQVWEARDVGDTVRYDMYEEEVLTITEQMIGLRRYYQGFAWNSNTSIDAHYLAFNCDHKIDKLLSATVDFYTQSWKHTVGQSYKFGEKIQHTVNLYDYQMAESKKSGWFGKEKYWHRMNSTTEFVKEVEAEGEEKENLLKYSWILNFYETTIEREFTGSDIVKSLLIPGYMFKGIYDGCTKSGTYVSDVTLLRLEFEYDGEIYNLGVVSNTQSGSNKPTNSNSEKFNLLKWLEEKTGVPRWVWIMIAIAIPVMILLPVLSAFFPAFREILTVIFKGLGTALTWLFKGIVFIIRLPIRAIKALIQKIKDGKG